MATYAFYCVWHGEFDANGMMESPPQQSRCTTCGHWSPRRFTAPQFTEDRQRLGPKFSKALGAPMPDTRRGYERELAKLGAEPCSPKTMPQAWKEGIEYKRHVDSGGERDRAFETKPHPSSKPGKLTVQAQMKAAGTRIG